MVKRAQCEAKAAAKPRAAWCLGCTLQKALPGSDMELALAAASNARQGTPGHGPLTGWRRSEFYQKLAVVRQKIGQDVTHGRCVPVTGCAGHTPTFRKITCPASTSIVMGGHICHYCDRCLNFCHAEDFSKTGIPKLKCKRHEKVAVARSCVGHATRRAKTVDAVAATPTPKAQPRQPKRHSIPHGEIWIRPPNGGIRCQAAPLPAAASDVAADLNIGTVDELEELLTQVGYWEDLCGDIDSEEGTDMHPEKRQCCEPFEVYTDEDGTDLPPPLAGWPIYPP